jgi:nucleotide-binding universal stress UspA family protein
VTVSGRILIGFDGSEQAHDALHLGAGVARAEGAEVVVVANFADIRAEGDENAFDEALAEIATPLFDDALTALSELKVRTEALALGSAARALHILAEVEGADAVVLGSTHRGPAGRVFPGSVAERLLHGCPCAVLVAPRGYATRDHFGLGVIGFGYDGGPESRVALRQAVELAEALDARLRIITALPVGDSSVQGATPGAGQWEATLTRTASAIGREVETELAVEEGDPAAVLVTHGVELDLLVVGSRGYGALRRVVLGSVSEEVMRNAPCPVWVTPRGSYRPYEPSRRRATLAPGAVA